MLKYSASAEVATNFCGQQRLTGELKRYVGKDFDVDVVEEGEYLKVILTT